MRLIHNFPLGLVWPDNWREATSLIDDGKNKLHAIFTNEEYCYSMSPFTPEQIRLAYQSQMVFSHYYSAVQRGKHWYIREDHTQATGPTSEATACWRAALWNYWGSKFDRMNVRCIVPEPEELNRLWLSLMTNAPYRDEEDEDRLCEEPQQRSLWEEGA